MTRFFEDFEEGEQIVSPGRTITEAEHSTFAGLGGNLGSIHMNAEMMEDTEYGGRLVFGILVIAVMEGLRMWSDIGKDLEKNAVAHYGMDGVRFVNPVFIGDTIYNEMEILELRDRDEDTGILVLEEKGVNQDDEVVVVLESKLVVKKRP